MLHGNRHLVWILIIVSAMVVGLSATPTSSDREGTDSAAMWWPIEPVYYADGDCLDNDDELPDC